MKQISNNPGCCPHANAKIFEIILIIGFLLTIILLIINLALTIWFFKNSHSLFIIEIGLLGLNALSFILSIILRIWRSDGSVLNSNLSSSNTVAVVNLIFVIINLLLSIAEEVLFSFVFPFIIYNIGEMTLMNNLFNGAFNDNNINFGWNNNLNNDDRNLNDDYYDWDDDYNWDYDDDDYWNSYSGLEENKLKNFYKIMDKLDEEKGEFGIDIDDDADFTKILKKLNTLKILPWIAFNFNILIQFIMFIFIIILIGRIKRRSDFGFSRNVTNQTSQNTMLGKRKSSDLKKLGLRNIDSAQKNLGKKKHKKKSKRKSIRVHNKY
jgi:hypothetical protein